jgi:hypothetical protein
MKLHNKRKFTQDEDHTIKNLAQIYGTNNWKVIAKQFPDRNARQLRERWRYYLNPQLNKNSFTPEEDNIIIEGRKQYGNSWKTISEKLLPNRTDISIRNRFRQIEKEGFEQKELKIDFFDFKFSGLDQDLFPLQNEQFHFLFQEESNQ